VRTRRQSNTGLLSSAAWHAAPTAVPARELKARELPPPRAEGGQSLTATLKLQHSTGEYSDRPPDAQTLFWEQVHALTVPIYQTTAVEFLGAAGKHRNHCIYATLATAHNQANVANHCNDSGPHCDSRYDYHYNWCITAVTTDLQSETQILSFSSIVGLILFLSAFVPLNFSRFQNLMAASPSGGPSVVTARLECIRMPQAA
jgi:hypothetical protein